MSCANPAIVAEAGQTLDFSRPASVVIFGVLHFFDDRDDPAGVVGRLAARLAPGSYLALTHLARDVEGKDLGETFSRLNAVMAESVILRSRDEVDALFGDLEPAEPGVVQLPRWRPDPGTPAAGPLPMWCGVARKA